MKIFFHLLMNNTEHGRLEYVVSAFFTNRTEAALAIGVSLSQLGNYTSGRNNLGVKMMNALKSAGINDIWVKRGEGSMFADNEAGRALKKSIEGSSGSVSEPQASYGAVTDELRQLQERTRELEIQNRTLKDVIGTRLSGSGEHAPGEVIVNEAELIEKIQQLESVLGWMNELLSQKRTPRAAPKSRRIVQHANPDETEKKPVLSRIPKSKRSVDPDSTNEHADDAVAHAGTGLSK